MNFSDQFLRQLGADVSIPQQLDGKVVLKALPPKCWADLGSSPRAPLVAVIVANPLKIATGTIFHNVFDSETSEKHTKFRTKLVYMNPVSVHVVFEDRLSAPSFKAKE